MQHIHKHSQGVLAEMWKKNVAVHCWTLHSQRIIWSSTINRNIHFFHWSYRVLCSATMSLIQPFPSLLVGRESGKLKGSGSASWSVNRFGLAQRRSVVEEGSEARVSAWAFRRSTMSWWEAPSATNCAVCPFWGENRQNMSQRHIKDIAVAVLFLTVAVLCRTISRNRTLQYTQIHCTWPDATRRAEFSIWK